jgi:TM2 domain-containing membrane protein YozV
MRLLLVTLVLSLFCALSADAQRFKPDLTMVGKAVFRINEDGSISPRSWAAKKISKDNPRLVAIALDVSLGVFGMHRIYLGTDVKVPVFYTLTLGGGMVLWIADLVLLITTDDITKYMNNPNVFMWNEG